MPPHPTPFRGTICGSKTPIQQGEGKKCGLTLCVYVCLFKAAVNSQSALRSMIKDVRRPVQNQAHLNFTADN